MNSEASPHPSGIDLQALKAELAVRADTLAPFFLPNGRREGRHWVTGDITGAPGRSFKVCLSGDKAGLCKDFATDDKGGTLIDVCMAVRGCDFNTAVAHCGELVGLRAPAGFPRRSAAGGVTGGPAPQPRADAASSTSMAGAPPPSTPSAPALSWEQCRAELTPEQIERFEAWRGFAPGHGARLRDENLLGSHEGHIALPVLDLRGTCIGVQYFPENSRGYYTRGAVAHPLCIGRVAPARRVYGFESPWDAFAYYECCGLAEDEAIISTRGVDHAPKLAGRIPETAEFIVFRQNDAPDAQGRIPDEEWFARILQTLDRPVRSVRVPDHLKDLNDWVREGVTAGEVRAAIAAGRDFGDPEGSPLTDLADTHPDPEKTLLGNRYLCTGGSMLFVGPSGIGKSSASVQQDILWSLGREAFGIRPARPLRILTVQAENDDGDIGEMARGVGLGLDLTGDDWAAVRERVIYVHENRRSGAEFLARLRKLLRRWRPHLVRIDPLFAYTEGDVIKPENTKALLRDGLNPLLDEFQCGAIVCHHTPKSTRGTSAWRDSDWMYAAAGNADITNWARAVLVIDPTHHTGIFRFIAAKRQRRIGWVDEEGNNQHIRHYCHAGNGTISWRHAGEEDLAAAEAAAADNRRAASGKSLATIKTKADVLALVPAAGSMSKNALIAKANSGGMGLNRAKGLLDELIHDEDLYLVRRDRAGTRPELHVSRQEPRAEETCAEEPMGEEPDTEEPDTEESGAGKPDAEEPRIEESSTEEPDSGEPHAEDE